MSFQRNSIWRYLFSKHPLSKGYFEKISLAISESGFWKETFNIAVIVQLKVFLKRHAQAPSLMRQQRLMTCWLVMVRGKKGSLEIQLIVESYSLLVQFIWVSAIASIVYQTTDQFTFGDISIFNCHFRTFLGRQGKLPHSSIGRISTLFGYSRQVWCKSGMCLLSQSLI